MTVSSSSVTLVLMADAVARRDIHISVDYSQRQDSIAAMSLCITDLQNYCRSILWRCRQLTKFSFRSSRDRH
jgi:hypothetical protein